MKGIILAGGTGSRLYPITNAVSKQLLPVYDKPMIFYPISVLMLAGIRDILIITTKHDQSAYKNLLGDGSNFGVRFSFAVQDEPNGLGEAFIIGEDFIGKENVCLILGDNIFWGQGFTQMLQKVRSELNGATVFGYKVKDPSRFGIIELASDGTPISIEEKPDLPKSNLAVTGLYFYDNNIIDIAKSIPPSSRGEIEITSINQEYLSANKLSVELLGRGFAWLDSGTFDSLLEASLFVETLEKRQGFKLACLEEIAFNLGWIDKKKVSQQASKFSGNSYGEYLVSLLQENYL